MAGSTYGPQTHSLWGPRGWPILGASLRWIQRWPSLFALLVAIALGYSGWQTHGSSLAASGNRIAPNIADYWFTAVVLSALLLLALAAPVAWRRTGWGGSALLGLTAAATLASIGSYLYFNHEAGPVGFFYFYFYPGVALAWGVLGTARGAAVERLQRVAWMILGLVLVATYLALFLDVLEINGPGPALEALAFLIPALGLGVVGALLAARRAIPDANGRLAMVGIASAIVYSVTLAVFLLLHLVLSPPTSAGDRSGLALSLHMFLASLVLGAAWTREAALIPASFQRRLDVVVLGVGAAAALFMLTALANEPIGRWIAAMGAAWLASHSLSAFSSAGPTPDAEAKGQPRIEPQHGPSASATKGFYR